MTGNKPDDAPDLMISGIQHFSFCRRQWALIHIEQQWAENFFTADGRILHERTDDPFFTEKRGEVVISRALPVRSDKLGITGTCDVVEFTADSGGVPISGRDGKFSPRPVEYKRGKSKTNDADRLQLCAQALCLEEMFCCGPIEYGFLYYGETRRREKVELNAELREKTLGMFAEMRRLYERGYTPRPKPSKKCESCSLKNICLPKLQKYQTARAYTDELWNSE